MNILKKFFIYCFAHFQHSGRKSFLLMDNISNPNAECIDNFCMFEYLYREHPEIDAYYWQNSLSPTYKANREKYGNRILPFQKSISWGIIFRLLSVRYWLDSFQRISVLNLDNYLTGSQIITVYTQHGVNFFKPADWASIGSDSFERIVVSSDHEKELIQRNSDFCDENCIPSGLVRWDLLQRKPSMKVKTVFIYLTCRKDPKLKKSVINKTLEVYEEIKKDPVLNNLQVGLAVHHENIKALRAFPNESQVKFMQDSEIAEWKEMADVLITDYSSMAFDFIVQGKRVIFVDVPNVSNNRSFWDSFQFKQAENEVKKLKSYCQDTTTAVELLKSYCFMQESHTLDAPFNLYKHDSRREFLLNNLLNSTRIENTIPSNYPIELNTKYFLCSLSPFRFKGVKHPLTQQNGTVLGQLRATIRFTAPRQIRNVCNLVLEMKSHCKYLCCVLTVGTTRKFVLLKKQESFVPVQLEMPVSNQLVVVNISIIPLSFKLLKHCIKQLLKPTSTSFITVKSIGVFTEINDGTILN